MVVTEQIQSSTLKELRKHFKNKGTIKECAELSGLHRNTVSRAVEMGRATREVVNKILEYYNEQIQQPAA